MMRPEERRSVASWCRNAVVDDTADDGVCRFTLKFKVRDADMAALYEKMNHDDACGIASSIVGYVCRGVDDCFDDWMNPDEEDFTLETGFEDGFIVMKGAYRT